ncbi:NADP-dependent oxidoreductase [Vannielia litorea]|uniref:NADP-dependent oxidoreductase n=1 Tax=Vannielia litorea TaxID=1217970 RepID=UPI001BCB6131|nr:NADP-dependent oxidoreductase [Vannielia litorea]MBS8224663.1 NADP-dependent oxidoreductase [Vannielia litorea]
MKAVQFSEYGGPEVLKVVEVDEPHTGPGQVRIAVRAAGVNPAEWKIRAGYFQEFMPVEFPAGVGFEAAGIVDEIGEGVTGVAVGDAVFGHGSSTVAEYAVLTYWAHKPDDMPFDVAGGLSVASETAIRALNYVGTKAGETVLICGAAGGVGSAAIQIARARGITVIGTASAAKHDYLAELGATPTSYEPGLADRVKALAPHGVDAALDLAGAGIIPELIEITGDASRVISIVDFTAPEQGAQFSPTPQEHPERALQEAANLFSEGALKLRVEKTFPMAQIVEAQALSAEGHVTGKLVITVS